MALTSAHNGFKPCVESMQLPGEPQASNLLILKGPIVIKQNSETFPIKIILVNGFPFRPPKVYVDKSLSQSVVQSKQYLGQFNEVTIPYLRQWNPGNNSSIRDLVQYIDSVF